MWGTNGNLPLAFFGDAEAGRLYTNVPGCSDQIIIEELPIILLKCSKRVNIYTYRFEGSYMAAYLKQHGIEVSKARYDDVSPEEADLQFRLRAKELVTIDSMSRLAKVPLGYSAQKRIPPRSQQCQLPNCINPAIQDPKYRASYSLKLCEYHTDLVIRNGAPIQDDIPWQEFYSERDAIRKQLNKVKTSPVVARALNAVESIPKRCHAKAAELEERGRTVSRLPTTRTEQPEAYQPWHDQPDPNVPQEQSDHRRSAPARRGLGLEEALGCKAAQAG
ncbi:MAG: hypothetical protein AAF125_17155 [Chloroflexota bacterium]